MSDIEDVLKELTLDYPIVLQWIRMDWKNDGKNDSDARNLLHQHVDTGVEVK